MTRVDINETAVRALLRDPPARALLGEVGGEVAGIARGLAPKRTGAGAASIHSDVDGEDVRVTWGIHYMFFHEVGTRYMSAEPFLRPALDYAHI